MANNRKTVVLQRVPFDFLYSHLPCFDASFLLHRLGLHRRKESEKEHLVQADNGEWWIRKAREKTDNMCGIPLLDIPRLILEKYQSNPICNEKGLLLPVPSNQRMNSYLKEIADVCGIQKNLSTHIARHTFASLAIANKVSLESIAKMLGHTDIRTTRIYAKIMNSTIANEMKVLQNKFAI